ncbi:DUF2075 domain-containing protein [Acinetobacter modestus]|uniref:DUF2075 domain-containing protein n=1 Tax=Acinetobacter modestus TaxID=1776740 RepID=UPI0030175793
MNTSYYQSSIDSFLNENKNTIFGQLARHHQHDLEDLQKNAWLEQIEFLQQELNDVCGHLYFEFSIPRMGKRVDNILIINNLIFVIEFKVGDRSYSNYAQNQTIDYCLDLQNFHEGSHNKMIVRILIATNAPSKPSNINDSLNLTTCILCNKENFKEILLQILDQAKTTESLDIHSWENSVYKPTPTIIEAAQALYKGHSVKEISRSDAGTINLSNTSHLINKIIEESKTQHKKSICFLTGVPGAGKTLAGLNIANERLKTDESEHSVFLSGNGPLVDVLREALTRDSVESAKKSGQRVSRTEAERKAKAFIQNIHHFRDDNLRTDNAPIEKVVVFDEAQRAWQKEQVSKFMQQKKGIPNFDMSEPEYLISVMNRHDDWCTIICLIGGGQEINTGEAGVSEWIKSLKTKYQAWNIYYSDKILAEPNTYLNDLDLSNWVREHGHQRSDLHLSTSIRSFRSEKVASLIQSILDNQNDQASKIYQDIKHNYPIKITRDLAKAKAWLRNQARGTERIGLIASSGAKRLKAEGIYVKNDISPTDWFLNHQDDTRSSYYLEDIATEFDIQGLEIDYTCVTWDINLYYDQGWQFQSFKGSKWQNINKDSTKSYLINAYRVLLTRARQGMVIFIPAVEGTDPTRPQKHYDSIYNYLISCGLDII